jgi:hypothetical protein
MPPLLPGQGVLVVVREEYGAQPELTQIGNALDRLASRLCLGQCRKKQSRQDTNDRDYYQ